jgi:hypothetical protein
MCGDDGGGVLNDVKMGVKWREITWSTTQASAKSGGCKLYNKCNQCFLNIQSRFNIQSRLGDLQSDAARACRYFSVGRRQECE